MSDKYFANVQLLCGFDGADAATSFTDESNAARTATFNGNAQLDTGEKRWGSASLMLDGTGDFITFPHSADLSVSSGNLTIECWFRTTDSSARLQALTNKRASTSGQEHGLYLGTDKRLRLLVLNSGSNVIDISSATVCAINTWYHGAVSKVGTTWYMHLNGLIENSAVQSNSAQTNTEPFRIGRDGFNTGRDWAGWIDEVRFTKGVARYGNANFRLQHGPFSRTKNLGVLGSYFQPVVMAA